MSKATIAKIAAVVCSAATLGALGIAASAQTTLDVNPGKVEKTTILAGKVEADPGELVEFPVYIYQPEDTHYAATGLRLIYAEGLTIQKNKRDSYGTKGDAGNDVTQTFSLNEKARTLGLGTMGTDGEWDSGVAYTCLVQVPENATPGTEYPMVMEVESWLDKKSQPVDTQVVAGWIKIVGEVKETTTTTAEPVAQTTTTTTAVTTPIATTTTTAEPVAPGTTTTTAEPVAPGTTTTSGGSAGSTTTTTGKGAVATTTAKSGNGGSGNKDSATKTGDAGVGVAVAGLMIAAGAAVAATRKKKED